MTRTAANRDTPLTREEIAAEALRQFDDDGPEPSIRRLASALRVTPSAIYHHYPSQESIVQAAVELVWLESTQDVLEILPDPFSAPPEEVILSGGLAARRAFGRHPQVARHIADQWVPSQALTAVLGLLANVFERLGFDEETTADAFHVFGTYTIGSVLFAAARTNAHVQAERDGFFRADYADPDRQRSSEPTRAAIEGIMNLAAVDPVRDEELFVSGLRRLVASFADQTSG